MCLKQTADGAFCFFEDARLSLARCYQVFDAARRVLFLVVFDHEVMRLHRQLEAERAASTRSKQQLMTNILHEIKTPLNTIYFSFQTLLCRQNEIASVDFEQVLSGFQCAELVRVTLNSFGDLEDVLQGRFSPFFCAFELETLLDESLAIFQQIAEFKQIEIAKLYGESLGAQTRNDKERLIQVVVILLSFCLRNFSAGRLKVSLERQSENLSSVELLFEGQTLTAEHLERFRRLLRTSPQEVYTQQVLHEDNTGERSQNCQLILCAYLANYIGKGKPICITANAHNETRLTFFVANFSDSRSVLP